MKSALVRTLGFLVMAVVAVSGTAVAYLLLSTPDAVQPPRIQVEMSAARIARGRYIYVLADCDGCHSERDYTRFSGPVVDQGRGRGVVFPAEMGLPGIIVAPNITPDPKTGIGAWTDGEKIRAIRDGISRDGRPLFPLMPYGSYRHLSDEDVQSLVAYLNVLEPVSHALPKSSLRFPASLIARTSPHPAGSVPHPDTSDRVTYGKYLVTVGLCASCHTSSEQGQPAPGKTLAGGERFWFGFAEVTSTNITPCPKTGIGAWSEEEFVSRFHRYEGYVNQGPPRVGPENFTPMPWLHLATLPAGDLKAMYAYLRTVPAVYHIVKSRP